MKNFIKVSSLEEIKTLKEKVSFLAGGTDIFTLYNDGLPEENIFCDISGLNELKKIYTESGNIHIGALATFSRMAASKIININCFALARAASHVGAPQIRNRGTIGGNIANASPAGDSIPPLYVLGAMIKTTKRIIPIVNFFTGPKNTVLKKNELILEIIIPREKINSSFIKIGPRKALAISKVSAAAAVRKKNGKIEDIRIAVGAAGPTVLRMFKAESYLKGLPVDNVYINKASEIIKQEICPVDDFRCTCDYRLHTAGIIVKRLLRELLF